jgi:hypothetical protein
MMPVVVFAAWPQEPRDCDNMVGAPNCVGGADCAVTTNLAFIILRLPDTGAGAPRLGSVPK